MRLSRSGRWSIVVVAVLCALPPGLSFGATVAYWRFEEGPADANVTKGDVPDGMGFYPGVADSSGNGNELSAWSVGGCCGFAYRTDIPAATVLQTGAANNFSAQNTGNFPAMWTETGTFMQTFSPAAFTIEASFKLSNAGWRTIVGRDSRGAATINGDLAALYFQVTDNPASGLAIKFADVSGVWHEAVAPAGTITLGRWYHAAAVSDGSTLSLYLYDVQAATGYQLVAGPVDLTASSANTALTAGTGDGGDWDAGNWTVGRGLYAGGHGDRLLGFVDEVRISDTALSPDQFLFAQPSGSELQSIDLQVTYTSMTVGGVQQAAAIGDYGPGGTLDITAAAKGTTYNVTPSSGVVSISPDGLITAEGVGGATITATNDGVTSPPVVISVDPAPTIAVAGPGVLLVDLRATHPTAGTALWENPGLLGDFASIGNPVLGVVAGAAAVTFDTNAAYQGPVAPLQLRGGEPRTIEVWAYNPVIECSQCIETMVAWGHRGGPCGSNLAYGFGDHGTWGAVAGWCPNGDIGWNDSGGSPPLGEWRHLVYTYDPNDAGGTTRLYDNGVQANLEISGGMPTHPGYINLAAQNLSPNALDLFATERGQLSLANVRIHHGALTADQVVQNYNAGIQLYELDQMAFTPRSLDASPFDPDAIVTLAIPPSCNAGQNLAVTVTSSNPAVAKPAGSNGSAVVNFTAGGPTVQTLAIDMVAPGQAVFTLSSDKNCPTGLLSTLTVNVYAAEAIDLQLTFDIMQVNQVQQARVIGTFGPAGTRDISAAAFNTTYATAPAGILNVSPDGQITAEALGTGTLTATHEGLISPERTIVVKAPGDPRLKIAGSGILLVDLSATDATAGQATWINKGSLGDFAAIGQPVVEVVAEEQAVTFDGLDAYQGPPAPTELRGGQGRTIEVWALNPAIECSLCIETMVAWGHRGGPCGSNLAFGFGDHGTWGGVAGWCDNGDIGWNNAGGSPPLGQWRHLVYTYDPNDSGGTTRLYDNGVLANFEGSGAMPTHPGNINLMVQNLSPNPNDVWMGDPANPADAEVGSLSVAVVRVHDGALTPEDVDHNFRLGILGLGQIRPDLDLDGDVDSTDYVIFRDCAAGPEIPLSTECRLADFDDDGDGDQDDHAIFQRCYSGEGVAASPGCE